jgi:large subunit ribosomal protein L15
MPLYRRLPKRGFKNPFRQEFVVINVGTLQQAVDGGRIDPAQPVDETAMQAAGLFRRRRDGVRLLAKGELTAALRIHVTGASKAAVAAVEKAGGSVSTEPVVNDARASGGASPGPEKPSTPPGGGAPDA